jgi:eukaryotic-like serine/threonine-protein kinase
MSNATRVEALFFEALEKGTAAERAAFLDSACGGDAELRRQVEKLLKAHSRVGDFLKSPIVEQLAAAPERPNASPGQGSDRSTNADDDEDNTLAFLQPSTRPDSLGRIGHYEVLEVLGKGGFGIVFRAFD